MIKKLPIHSSLVTQEQKGSVEYQVCCLTNQIIRLTQHLQLHRKDYSSQIGLWKIVGKRRRLLFYLSKRDILRYNDLISQLGIRGLKTR
uniref:Small ribosomal subunit protein uS15c n=1 Tax=Parasitaxus usta TaxID=56899 RepID=A0A5J6CE50_9CONI|nr:ribosomal protein S15 [Parasitaxus usta]QEQ14304.1 ribosomal protein S15 [Parasitaxus usta]